MDLPEPRIELGSPVLQTNSLPTELSGRPKSTGQKTHRGKTVYFVGNCSCLVLLEFELGGIDDEFRA